MKNKEVEEKYEKWNEDYTWPITRACDIVFLHDNLCFHSKKIFVEVHSEFVLEFF